MKFSGKSGYQAIDSEDPDRNSAPPPPYSPALREEAATAPPSSDFRKDYEQYDRYKPIPVSDGQPSNPHKAAPSLYPPPPPSAPHPPRSYGMPAPPFPPAPPPPFGPRCGRRNGKPCHIRSLVNKAKQANKKVILLGLLVGGALAMFLTRFVAPSVWTGFDHCVRDGSVTWDGLPSNIPFDKNVRVVIRGHVSGGSVKITPLSANDVSGGSIQTRVNVYPADFIDRRFHYSLDKINDETRLTIQLPENKEVFGRSCVYIEMQIALPAHATFIYVSTANMAITTDESGAFHTKSVELNTKNARIELPNGWQGDDIRLTSTNAALEFTGDHPLHAIRSITLETSNGAIRLDGADTIQGPIRMVSTNGRIRADGTHAATLLEVSSSNGSINIEDSSAQQMVIRSSNGGINLSRINAEESLTVQTSNGRITAQLDGSSRVKASFTSSNARIRVAMPPDWMGPFKASTTSSKIRLSGSDITLEDDKPTQKSGYKSVKDAEGSCIIHTSNARVHLDF